MRPARTLACPRSGLTGLPRGPPLIEALLRDARHSGRELHAAPRDDAQERPRDRDGREHAQGDAHGEQYGEPTHGPAGECEEDKGGYKRRQVAVQDRREALLVADADGGARRLPTTNLFFNPLEDHHVRISRDTDAQHDPRYPRQRHRYWDGDDEPPEQEGVDEER